MNAGTTIIVLEDDSVVAAPTILVVTRTGATAASIRIEPGWTRILIYYPDINGTLLFDSDDPEDAASIINGDGYDEISLSLPPEAGINTTIPLEAVDQVGALDSNPTPFQIPPLVGGGARSRTRGVRAR